MLVFASFIELTIEGESPISNLWREYISQKNVVEKVVGAGENFGLFGGLRFGRF